ncbi:MAG: DUF2933 domain-containing protein [Rubrobacteraceae bacterium]
MLLFASLAVAGYFLVAEHRVHLSGYVPYALIGLFVVFHLFMHAGHGGHAEEADEKDVSSEGGER